MIFFSGASCLDTLPTFPSRPEGRKSILVNGDMANSKQKKKDVAAVKVLGQFISSKRKIYPHKIWEMKKINLAKTFFLPPSQKKVYVLISCSCAYVKKRRWRISPYIHNPLPFFPLHLPPPPPPLPPLPPLPSHTLAPSLFS